MRVNSGATIATLVRPPRHRSPRATEDGGGIANPGRNSYIQHGSEPPRSKLGQTWFIDHEAHLLQSRLIVNSNFAKYRYSGTIPMISTRRRSPDGRSDVGRTCGGSGTARGSIAADDSDDRAAQRLAPYRRHV